MKKAVIIAATAVAVVGGSALAYTAYAHSEGWRHARWNFNAGDMNAFAEARIAALKAGLTLTPEQEKLWPSVETAIRDLAKKRIEWREERRAERGDRDRDVAADPIGRLRRGADRMSQTGADLKRLADAAEPLYQSLNDDQKRRMHTLMRAGMRRTHEGRGWRRHGDLGDEGRHFGPRMGGQFGPHMGGQSGPNMGGDFGPRMGWHGRLGFDDDEPRGPSGPAERL